LAAGVSQRGTGEKTAHQSTNSSADLWLGCLSKHKAVVLYKWFYVLVCLNRAHVREPLV